MDKHLCIIPIFSLAINVIVQRRAPFGLLSVFWIFCMFELSKLKRFLIILFLLFGIGISNDYLAQTGGRKREGRSRARKSLFAPRSQGNADVFAGGGSKRGIFSRLFRRDPGAWQYKSSGSVKSHNRDNRRLFNRHRTEGRQNNARVQDRQNRERARKRVRGNKVFSKKKY